MLLRQQSARLRDGRAVDSEARLDPDAVILKVDYRAAGTDVVMRREFNVTRSYPAVAAFDDLKKCLDDAAFLQWFGSALLRACVPVDRVLTIKAARGQEPVVTLATEESLATAPVQGA